MSFEEAIAAYGYWAVFAGTLMEGETIVVLAGFAAHRGYLTLGGVAAAAFAGSFLIDQAIFWLGRRFGTPALARWPRWQEPAERAFRLLRRYDTVFVLGFRFLYGLRTISPFTIGAAGLDPLRYLWLNALAAAIWAGAFSAAGYFFGRTAEALFGNLARHERPILAALLAAGLTVWLVHILRRRRRGRSSPAPTPD